MPFHFRYFTINDKQSTMRVGTDSMLLGSWASPGTAWNILDIGTGSGILALMMAQKTEALVDAVELDQPSAHEAALNFGNSPWAHRLKLENASIQEFSKGKGHSYDFIITNPPFFSGSLKSPSQRKNVTRHDHELSLSTLVSLCAGLLAPGGSLAMVTPAFQRAALEKISMANSLYPVRLLSVRPTPAKSANRILVELSTINNATCQEAELTILGTDGRYSLEYLKLTKEYHNF